MPPLQIQDKPDLRHRLVLRLQIKVVFPVDVAVGAAALLDLRAQLPSEGAHFVAHLQAVHRGDGFIGAGDGDDLLAAALFLLQGFDTL